MQDLGHGFGLAHLNEDNLALVEGLKLLRAVALHGVIHGPDGKTLPFARAHAAPEGDQHPREGHDLPHVPAFEQKPPVAHDPARLQTAGAARAGDFGGQFRLVQQNAGLLVHVPLACAVHVLRVERVARAGLHPELAASQGIGQAYLLHGPQHGRRKLLALGPRGLGQEDGESPVPDACAKGLPRQLAAKGFHQFGDQLIGKGVAGILRHLAHTVEADGHKAERTAVGAGPHALAAEVAREGSADVFRLLREALKEHLPGREARAGIKPPGLVKLQIVEAEADDAGQRRQQGPHPFLIRHTGHKDAELFPAPDKGNEQLAFARQPFGFGRTGLTRKIDRVRLKGQYPVQAVPQPLLKVQQIAPDKAGGGFGHAGPTMSGARARRDPPCSA